MQEKNQNKLAEAFGVLLSKRRELKGLTQEELAELAGTSRGVVNNVESGRHDVFPEQLVAFSEVLQCSLAELLPDPATLGTPIVRSIAYGGLVNNDDVLLKLLMNYGSSGGNYLSGRATKSQR